MRTAYVIYSCFPCKGFHICLRMEAWDVKLFPMTYTVAECLEEWCESVGWRYISHEGKLSVSERVFYRATIEMPVGKDCLITIRNYVRGVVG